MGNAIKCCGSRYFQSVANESSQCEVVCVRGRRCSSVSQFRICVSHMGIGLCIMPRRRSFQRKDAPGSERKRKEIEETESDWWELEVDWCCCWNEKDWMQRYRIWIKSCSLEIMLAGVHNFWCWRRDMMWPLIRSHRCCPVQVVAACECSSNNEIRDGSWNSYEKDVCWVDEVMVRCLRFEVIDLIVVTKVLTSILGMFLSFSWIFLFLILGCLGGWRITQTIHTPHSLYNIHKIQIHLVLHTT